MPLLNVTDPSDPRLAPYCRLTDAQLRSRLDPSQGIVVCESEIAVRQALESGMEPLSLLVTERRLGALAGLIAKAGEAASGPLPTYVLPDAAAERLTGYRLHRGVLCVLRRPPELAPERAFEGAQRACVLDALVDVSNVGAVFRSAAALGVDAVLVGDGCADPWNRRSVRVSMGTAFRVPWARLACPVAEAVAWLRGQGFVTAALALTPDAIPLGTGGLEAAPRLAVVLGNESFGLPAEVVSACDVAVRIPMCRDVDSLNVAAAASVAFWELCRRPQTSA